MLKFLKNCKLLPSAVCQLAFLATVCGLLFLHSLAGTIIYVIPILGVSVMWYLVVVLISMVYFDLV